MRAFFVAVLVTVVGYLLWGLIAAGAAYVMAYLVVVHGIQIMDVLFAVLGILLVLPFILGAGVGASRGMRRGMGPVPAAAAGFAGAVVVLLAGGLAGAESAASLASARLEGLYHACGAALGAVLAVRRAARV